jgi:hypothetical protein
MKTKIVGIIVCTLMLVATVLPVGGTIRETPTDDVVIWYHPPDDTNGGINIRCDRSDGIQRTLATDFECRLSGLITKVVLYGSWKDNVVGTINLIHLSIHDDIPAAVSPTNYSMPGRLRWEMNFTVFEESIFTVGETEWWWDPYMDIVKPLSENTTWEYTIDIPDSHAFHQEGTPDVPVIYWLDVYVKAEGGEFGWKTTIDHRIDDAVYHVKDDPYWFELRYPPPHPRVNESIDLACGIIGKELPPIVVIIDGVFDIFRIEPILMNTGNLTYFNLTWTMTISGGLLWPPSPATYNGTIPSLQPHAQTPIKSGLLLGLGPIEINITIDDQEPVTFNGFLFLFIIIHLK